MFNYFIINSNKKLKANVYLFELLRPEFVQQISKPLSSDAFSAFGADNNNEHNNEIVEVFEKLELEIIPRVAAELINSKEILKKSQLKLYLHQNGINLRYLGYFII